MATDVSIVIINYRSAAFTKSCLRSIYENNDVLRLEIVVIDNASYDGCGEMIRRDFPAVVFIQNEQNLGFGGANNLGIGVTSAPYILFLNPDTEVQGKAIDRLLAALKSLPDAGIAGAHLLNTDLTVQTTSITAFPAILNQILGTEYLQQKFPKARLWGNRPLFEQHRTPVVVDAISGACMMASRAALEQVHGFTTRYFMYAEDLDLCFKVKKAGWNVHYVPDSLVVHHGGRSSELRPECNYAEIMIRQSVFQFMLSHQGQAYAWFFRAATGAVAMGRLLLLLLLLPSALLPSTRPAVVRVWKKWTRILAWCIGMQGWARREGSSLTPLQASIGSSTKRQMQY